MTGKERLRSVLLWAGLTTMIAAGAAAPAYLAGHAGGALEAAERAEAASPRPEAHHQAQRRAVARALVRERRQGFMDGRRAGRRAARRQLARRYRRGEPAYRRIFERGYEAARLTRFGRWAPGALYVVTVAEGPSAGSYWIASRRGPLRPGRSYRVCRRARPCGDRDRDEQLTRPNRPARGE